jgi:hypothetical protein
MNKLWLNSHAPTSVADEAYSALLNNLHPLLQRLTTHEIYSGVSDISGLRIFMSNHVFAVWDFMTLLKSLQRSLTCIHSPWTPPRDTLAARLINEIVLSEETDEIAPGRYMGHFHLYLAAMGEVGADTKAIRDLIAALREGAAASEVLTRLHIPECTRRFVRATLISAEFPVHQVAAAFLLGRESLLPNIFNKVLGSLGFDRTRCESFRLYLGRHTELDQAQHGPMAERLLVGLCGADLCKWKEAENAARSALTERIEFWDALSNLMWMESMYSGARLDSDL